MTGMTTQSTQSVRIDDGAMDLYMWTPDTAPKSAVLLLQEIFGVGSYIRSVAERLAEAGYLVGAPDVFWRFAPQWAAEHDDAGLAASFEQVQKLDFPQAVSDCSAALEHVGKQPGITTAPAVLGFCLGGTLAWGVAASATPSCCVSYYGSGVHSMLEMISMVHCPTLFHFGNDDPYIPNDAVEKIADAIAGKNHFTLNVEHAGHAFDNHQSEMFFNESAAQSAWAKTMAFLTSHLPA
jgi:carboxymethylenebutenolidase